FFFSSRRRHTRFSRDWSSDVCSSDLRAMTPGCTVQACALRDSRKALEKAGIVVLGVSTDPVARLAKFAEKEKLDFTLLSDVDHAVADKYGVWGPKKFMGREFLGLRRT